MKKEIIIRMACIIILTMSSCNYNNKSNHKTTEMMENSTQSKEPVMGLGNLVTANFVGEAWLQMLSSQSEYDCSVYNVTFAPGTRNNWHSHTIGQILLCTEGIGYYQEKGKPARRLKPGDVVNIPANEVHWHGAAPESRFTHIGITPKASKNAAEWFGEVTQTEYAEAVKRY